MLVTPVLPRGWSRPPPAWLRSPERTHGSTGRYPPGSALVVDQPQARCPTGPVGPVARVRSVAGGNGYPGSCLPERLDRDPRPTAPVGGGRESYGGRLREDPDSHLDRTPLRVSRADTGNPSSWLRGRRDPGAPAYGTRSRRGRRP